MNLNKAIKSPVPVVLGSGFLGMILRIILYRTGFDEKGILPASHPLHLACLVLTAGVLVWLALRLRKQEAEIPGNSALRFLSGLAAGCFLLVHSLPLFAQALSGLTQIRRIRELLPLIQWVLTLGAAGAMVVCVLPGQNNRNIPPVCHGIICAAFAADMLSRYRVWSGNPQLPDYVFHVLAGAALSLGTYQTLALYTGLGRRKLQQFFCLSGLLLCVLCLAGPEPRAYYLGGALWSALCLLTPVPPEENAQEAPDVSA